MEEVHGRKNISKSSGKGARDRNEWASLFIDFLLLKMESTYAHHE